MFPLVGLFADAFWDFIYVVNREKMRLLEILWDYVKGYLK